jgi:hypothetical protein
VQIRTAKYGRFISSIILNIEMYCADILHKINGNFKEAYLIRHREFNITCTEDCRRFDFVMLVTKNTVSFGVETLCFEKCEVSAKGP